ncbi:hypothetical protein [Streptomyces sp. NBC_01763]|uniref:hypothetical protein n=1 Tax=Streptomyces sp. NBC_01763 TaxID=2975934 RepID=UPI002DDA112A|nr:hypothetical protein [Streptomyces sp. NBC_01763]WSC41417.1 hypothetical protein OHA08_41515 [Streptomyces sp. NBC_01763]
MVEQIGDADIDLVADAAYDGDRGALRVGVGPVEVATAGALLRPRDVSGRTEGEAMTIPLAGVRVQGVRPGWCQLGVM